jgi:hypothetical protein
MNPLIKRELDAVVEFPEEVISTIKAVPHFLLKTLQGLAVVALLLALPFAILLAPFVAVWGWFAILSLPTSILMFLGLSIILNDYEKKK